jgi:hypothetical protein
MYDSIDSLYQEDAAAIFLLVRCAINSGVTLDIIGLHRALTADLLSMMPANIEPRKEANSVKDYGRLETYFKNCCQGLLEVPPLRELPKGSVPGDEDFPPVSYLHLTVKDFLEKPEILTRNQRNSSKRMEPPLSILASEVMLLKQSHPRERRVVKILQRILKLAPQLSQEPARLHIPLLDECDRVMSNHWSGSSGH